MKRSCCTCDCFRGCGSFLFVSVILPVDAGELAGVILSVDAGELVGVILLVDAGELAARPFSIKVLFRPFYRKKDTLSSENKDCSRLIFYNDEFLFVLLKNISFDFL